LKNHLANNGGLRFSCLLLKLKELIGLGADVVTLFGHILENLDVRSSTFVHAMIVLLFVEKVETFHSFEVGLGSKFEPTMEMVCSILVEFVSNNVLFYHWELLFQE